MTLENYNYRTDPLFLRNQFDEKGYSKYKIPNIPKAEFTDNDFEGLLLLGFDKSKADDTKHNDRIVHFFLYDYKFEGIWKNPDKYIPRMGSELTLVDESEIPDDAKEALISPLAANATHNIWLGTPVYKLYY